MPNTEWTDAVLSEDGRRLTIMVGTTGPGDAPCNQNFEYEVVETDRSAVPDGWTTEAPIPAGVETNGWQQTFHRDGADWYFAVNQQPEADATTPEGTPTPVTVHGIEGLRYSGQMNDTMESIVWVEGGLSITVWGEMQGPPTFTHRDELLEIAEGVRLPADD